MKTIHNTIGFIDKHIETIVIGFAMIGVCTVGKWATLGVLWVMAQFA